MKWLIPLFFFFSISVKCIALNTSPQDILVFSPHPDDETLACGGTIIKDAQENKKIKVVFFTNGDAYDGSCALWLKKKKEELTASDYIAFGKERQGEALRATKKLGLRQEDVIFLSYPDRGLLSLWEEKYNTHNKLYKSFTTKKTSSPYNKTYNLAKQGYSRQNLVLDLEAILKDYKPKHIYFPHPQDTHKDHRATAYFLNLVLGELRKEKDNEWLDSTRVSYYLSHNSPGAFALKDSFLFSQIPSSRSNILNFKNQKKEALGAYITQLSLEDEKDFFEDFIKNDEEIFWDVPIEKETYLRQLGEEWLRIARHMYSNGYNVNFAPVADVADDIENMNHPLRRKQRMYSQDPQIVTELVSAAVSGMLEGKVIPVLKHFPGLGSVYSDSHLMLPKVDISSAELYKRDLIPFKEVINKFPDTWIMIDHAVYSSLDNQPASLSFEIQTKLLRQELGFKGVIVVDELLGMRAMGDYAFQEKIKEPYVGEITVRAFQAGADIAIIYPSPKDAQDTVFRVIKTVKQAVTEGRIKERDINDSVIRILKEKEKIFGIPLQDLLKDMPLEEKICQKLIFDYHKDSSVFRKYNIGGLRLYGQEKAVVQEAQKNSRIPKFIIGQHEGGLISQRGISTSSAYAIGKEYERIAVKIGQSLPQGSIFKNQVFPIEQKYASLNFNELDENIRQGIVISLINSLDKLIGSWLEIKQWGNVSVPPNYLSPLTHFDGKFEIKLFKDVPASWLREFLDIETAFYAYQLLKDNFDSWTENQRISMQPDEVMLQLKSLKEKIKKIGFKKDKSIIRILCLAAHPDDEDGEALVYLGRKLNCQTFILLATRGEGGENEVNSSLYEELGALRTQEMENAASVLGVKRVYYLGKKDFGYSSSLNEVYEKWDKEDTLKRLVYFFRLIRPQIIITKHNKFNNFDHAQHRALTVLAEEAFDLSGDAKAYPEMIGSGIFPWQPLKFYERSVKSDSAADKVVINPEERVSSEGKTCHQIAIEALSQHQSQGNWQWLKSIKSKQILYKLVKSRMPSGEDYSFFAGIEDNLFLTANLPDKNKKEISPSGLPGVNMVKNLKIGIVEKNNNVLFIALKTLGYDFKSLDEKFLKEEDLSQFDTIVLGQDSFAFSPVSMEVNSRVLEFVKNGGNLVVFPQHLHTQTVFSCAPGVLKIAFNPVSDENAPLSILNLKHPLFDFPNKISPLDFFGWVQERAVYPAFEYSNDFIELTSCLSNAGKETRGGYLIASFGRGSYIYAGYSWYRQFRAFHVGAYKNLSNMLAYPYSKKQS